MARLKQKVVIIEDDVFLATMYANKFVQEGFQVFTSSDGKKGLRHVQKELPDIVLLDILLPEQNGFEMLREMKKDEKLKEIPVILLTNLSQKSDIELGMSLGAAAYMIKAHFMPAEVVEKAKQILEERKK
jgi:twitching motility two-component system response regulator PilH